MPVITDFAGTETLAETKSRLDTLLTAYGYDSSGYSTWGNARTDLNSALTAIEETTINDGELASSFRSKLNALNAWSDYPAGGKVPNLVFDFEDEFYRANDTETTFGDSITFSRASSATYVDSDGVLQTAASGVPRIGHHVWNGSAWVNEGLLHESEARVNLNSASEALTVLPWSASSANTTLTADDKVAPDGNLTGTKVVATSSSYNGITRSVNTGSTIASKSFTLSLWVYADSTFDFDLRTRGTGSVQEAQNTTVSTVAGQWVRVQSTHTFTASADGNDIVLFLYTAEYGVNNTNTLWFWGVQLEEGSTPSSYIPTSGSTVTRAAETLTIPAAKLPWPTPNVIGSELVTNGTFDADLTGWTINDGGSSVTWNASGYADIDRNSGSFASHIKQTLSTSTGKVYSVSFDVVALSNEIAFRLNGSTFGSVYTSTGSYTAFFVASGVSSEIGFGATGSLTATGSIDNISVREIDPLSVSIQMDGRMTYADTNTFNTVRFLRWAADVNNLIELKIDTFSGTGDAVFVQGAASVFDSVDDVSAYSPDILVPFNIASRHGSTFINGAVDGTALTADTTPTALPDLSTTDLNLGYDYMGTIRTLRMWNQDITDAGIEEAST